MLSEMLSPCRCSLLSELEGGILASSGCSGRGQVPGVLMEGLFWSLVTRVCQHCSDTALG